MGAAGLAAALLLGACSGATGPAPRDRLHTHEGLNATLWLQTAAEYRASALQAFRGAAVQLDRALADPAWTAALEQQGDFGALPPAVILDMDEAIVHSDRFQAGLVAHDDAFRIADWNDWVRTETAEAIPGALDYVAHARSRGVAIFYVTNRNAEVETATLAILAKLGFPVEGGLEVLLTQDERPDWGADKSSRRAYLARTHRILQIEGDNLNDFLSGARTTPEARRELVMGHAAFWGTRWIVMPNPAYGGWEGALYGFDHGLPREEILRRKYQRLDPWR